MNYNDMGIVNHSLNEQINSLVFETKKIENEILESELSLKSLQKRYSNIQIILKFYMEKRDELSEMRKQNESI